MSINGKDDPAAARARRRNPDPRLPHRPVTGLTESTGRPTAAILLTGNELLRGVISDLNASHLARSLELHGFSVERSMTVGDGLDPIERGLGELVAEHDLVVTSGGLGPTHDDRTVEAIARLAGVELVVDQDVLDRVNRWTAEVRGPQRLRSRPIRRRQPQAGAHPCAVRTCWAWPAPLLGWCSTSARRRGGAARRPLRAAPPVGAGAAAPAAGGAVCPRPAAGAPALLRTYGMGESHVADIFSDLGGDPAGVETSICARRFEVEIDIRADQGAEQRGAELAAAMRRELGEYVFATDEAPVAEIVADAVRRPRLDAGHRRVVHGRCDRTADHRYPRQLEGVRGCAS